MKPWETLATGVAPDGKSLELRRRGDEFLIRADGHDLMSSQDDASSKALAELGLGKLGRLAESVLVGGLGMGFTLAAALQHAGPQAMVEVAELVEAVVRWNEDQLAAVAGRPLDNPRAHVHLGDVRDRIAATPNTWDAILLDVDNGPDALAHEDNARLYDSSGLDSCAKALRPGGVLGVWSFSDDPAFTKRCRVAGFEVEVVRVSASRKGRGRHHIIWVAKRW